MSRLLVVAYGTCSTCNQFLEQVGSSKEDAELLLRHSHGSRKHIFHGHLDFRGVSHEKAREIERRRVP